MSFNELLEQNKGADILKLVEGDNRIRVLCYPIKVVSEFREKDGSTRKSTQFVTWVIDRKDGQIKPLYFGKKILEQFAGLESDEENKFDTMPMPYDVNIKRTGTGKENTSYNLIAGRNLSPLTEEEKAAFADKPSIEEFAAKVEEKKAEKEHQEESAQASPVTEDVNVEDIPF